MGKPRRSWFDRLLVVIAGGAVVAAWSSLPANRVVLADRVRDGLAEPDFVLQFLRVTRTAHAMEHGFAAIPLTASNQSKLRRLLAGLATYRRTLADEAAGTADVPSRCEPRDDGSVVLVPDIDRTPAQAVRLKEDLAGQYAAVLEAVRRFDPSVVGVTGPPAAPADLAAPPRTARATRHHPSVNDIVTRTTVGKPTPREDDAPPMLPSRISVPASTGVASANAPVRADVDPPSPVPLPPTVKSASPIGESTAKPWPPRLANTDDAPPQLGARDRSNTPPR